MLDTPVHASLLRGVAELEPTDRGLRLHRLPAWARAQSPDPQPGMVEAQPSGVRLAVRTRATVVELDTLSTTTASSALRPARRAPTTWSSTARWSPRSRAAAVTS